MPDDVVTAPDQVPDHTDDGAAPLPPVRRTPGMRPALIVLGIAVVVVVVFGLMSALSPGTQHGPPPSSTPTKVAGTTLLAVPADQALKPIEHPGTPPQNIVDALTIPKGAVVTDHSAGTSATGYDERIDFSVPGADQAAVVAFYQAELDKNGWKRISVGPATNEPTTTQVLAQAAGDDGWYWEAGALVSPTAFGNGRTQSTPFVIRLFQVPDAD